MLGKADDSDINIMIQEVWLPVLQEPAVPEVLLNCPSHRFSAPERTVPLHCPCPTGVLFGRAFLNCPRLSEVLPLPRRNAVPKSIL